jgi:hypothetical protein
MFDLHDLAAVLGQPHRDPNAWTSPGRRIAAGPSPSGSDVRVVVADGIRWWTWHQHVPLSPTVARVARTRPFNGFQGRLFD